MSATLITWTGWISDKALEEATFCNLAGWTPVVDNRAKGQRNYTAHVNTEVQLLGFEPNNPQTGSSKSLEGGQRRER